MRGAEMISRRTVRTLASLALLIGTAVATSAPSIAGAKVARKVIVQPSGSLHSGQTVKVAGHGFTPGDSVYIVECLATAKNSTGATSPRRRPRRSPRRGPSLPPSSRS